MKHHHLGKRGAGVSLALALCLAGTMMPTSALALDFDSAVAQAASYTEPVTGSDWEWKINSTGDLEGYYDSGTGTLYAKNVEPDEGCWLVDLPSMGLEGAENATSLQILPGAKNLKNGAFLPSFPNIDTVYIPASVQEISERSFSPGGGQQTGFTALQHVYIAPGSQLTTIGFGAFGCSQISEIDLHDTEIETLTGYGSGGGPFSSVITNQNKVVTPMTEMHLPRNLGAMETAFFESCGGLKDLYIYSDGIEPEAGSDDPWFKMDKNANGSMSLPNWTELKVHCVDMAEDKVATDGLVAALKDLGVPEENFSFETTSDPEPAPGVGDGEGDEGNETDPGTTTPETPATPTTPTVPSNPSTPDTVTGGGF